MFNWNWKSNYLIFKFEDMLSHFPWSYVDCTSGIVKGQDRSVESNFTDPRLPPVHSP